MTRRCHNLEAAIDYCKSNAIDFDYERCKKHIKFYVAERMIVISLKNYNVDKVVSDIRRIVK
jgi:hypothetical protein